MARSAARAASDLEREYERQLEEFRASFDSFDKDGGGSIGPNEFEEFFFAGTLNEAQFFASMWELAELWAMDSDEETQNGGGFDPVRHTDGFCQFLQVSLRGLARM